MLTNSGYNLTQIQQNIDELILATVFSAEKYIHPAFMRYIVNGREHRLRPYEVSRARLHLYLHFFISSFVCLFGLFVYLFVTISSLFV